MNKNSDGIKLKDIKKQINSSIFCLERSLLTDSDSKYFVFKQDLSSMGKKKNRDQLSAGLLPSDSGMC